MIEARKWIAKRVLIYERRVLNLNKVTRFIRIALPPPWGTLFGVAEGVVRASGIGSFAQKKLDGVSIPTPSLSLGLVHLKQPS